MSFCTPFYFINVLIALKYIHFCSSETILDPTIQRNPLSDNIDNKRYGIEYVINLLHRIDANLAELERRIKLKDCTIIGGLPGADCELNLGDYVTLSPRNPGRKRSNRCAVFGIDCDEDSKNNLPKVSVTDRIRNRRKRDDKPQCLSDIPAADCDENKLSVEAQAQKALKPGNRNPGK